MRRSKAYPALLTAAVLVASTLTTYAQSQPLAFGRQTPRSVAISARLAPSALAAQSAGFLVYLPQIVNAPTISALEFSTAIDGGGAVDPRTEFDYGITDLFVTARVLSGRDVPWHTVWTINGQPAPNVGTSGTLASDDELAIDGICFGPLDPNGQVQCGSPIPRGTYQVDVYLDELLYRSGTAVVR